MKYYDPKIEGERGRGRRGRALREVLFPRLKNLFQERQAERERERNIFRKKASVQAV